MNIRIRRSTDEGPLWFSMTTGIREYGDEAEWGSTAGLEVFQYTPNPVGGNEVRVSGKAYPGRAGPC